METIRLRALLVKNCGLVPPYRNSLPLAPTPTNVADYCSHNMWRRPHSATVPGIAYYSRIRAPRQSSNGPFE
jgi:hypothetical protein